ncbi:hypothetical protein [Levyella massiliensis]|uniref:hypothetical protein n=1 Tax=Levyella massiliensis TaxID=938289 RepID=UPI003EC075F5
MLKPIAVAQQKEIAFEEKLECYFCHHAYFFLFFTGILAPILVLVAVALVTCIIMIPMSLLFGWL